jgi:hypothetical protein
MTINPPYPPKYKNIPRSFVGSPWAGTFPNLMLLVEVDDILSNKTVAKELSYMCNLYPIPYR